MAQRYSKQHDVIYKDLKNRSDHPSADMVYTSVKKKIPNISLGTVYRNLRDMADSGDALSFMVDGKEHFDGRNMPHLHLCCTECGSIEDILVPPERLEALADGRFKVENAVFQGVCENCQKRK